MKIARTNKEIERDFKVIKKYCDENRCGANTAIDLLIKAKKITQISRQSHYSYYMKLLNGGTLKEQETKTTDCISYSFTEKSLNDKYKDLFRVKILWLHDKRENEGACLRVTNKKTGTEKSIKGDTNNSCFENLEKYYKNAKN